MFCTNLIDFSISPTILSYKGERSPYYNPELNKVIMAKNITLKDVARHAKVSYQTVSKVIRGQKQVTPEVRARIYAAINELGYRPNIAARSLRLQASQLIGYSWQQDRHNQLSTVLQEFQHSMVECAEELGYHILLFPQRENKDLYATYAELVDSGRVDGFILSSVEYEDPRIPIIYKLSVPAVCFGRSGESMSLPYVDVDGRAGVADAVRHLISEGHHRIAIVAWPESSRVGTERLSGYRDAMEEADLHIDPAWVIRGAGETSYGYSAALQLLDLPERKRPTAIVTLRDSIAVGVMNAISERGLRVGRDIAVTGFDDMPAIHYIRPGVTTLRQPVWEVGQKVIDMLVALLKGEPLAQQRVLLRPELIVRESSQRQTPSPSQHQGESELLTHSR